MAETKLEHLATLLNLHAAHIEQFVEHMNTRPTPNAAAHCSAEQAASIFLAGFGQLTTDELKQAIAFWTSPAGKKERELGRTAATEFGTERAKPQASVTSTPSPKALALVRIHGVGETLGGLATAPVRVDEVESYIARQHAAKFTEDELDRVIAFHDSPAGRKISTISRDAVLQLSRIFGV